MNILRNTLLVVTAIGLTASCAHVPRMQNNDPETVTLRAQYLSENPKGVHNDEIERGEVSKGMNAMEVLASWGMPEKREVKKGANEECWFYSARDKDNGDYIAYELVLVDLLLKRWHVNRGTAGAGVRATEVTTVDNVRLEAPANDAFRGGKGAPKK